MRRNIAGKVFVNMSRYTQFFRVIKYSTTACILGAKYPVELFWNTVNVIELNISP